MHVYNLTPINMSVNILNAVFMQKSLHSRPEVFLEVLVLLSTDPGIALPIVATLLDLTHIFPSSGCIHLQQKSKSAGPK